MHDQNFRKSLSLEIHTCVHQSIRNDSFSENLGAHHMDDPKYFFLLCY